MGSTKLRNFFLLLALILMSGLYCQQALLAQRGSPSYPSTVNRDAAAGPNDPRKKLAKRMLKESFEAMQKESQQLVEMSIALRDDLHETTEDEMNLNAMKKAEAIEKLAEKIKNRIKNL